MSSRSNLRATAGPTLGIVVRGLAMRRSSTILPSPSWRNRTIAASFVGAGGRGNQAFVELLLVRHALPVRREMEIGAADPELSENGQAQAALLAESLAAEAPLDALYSSPLQRARQTAAPI